jgi:hypothetical protein
MAVIDKSFTLIASAAINVSKVLKAFYDNLLYCCAMVIPD